MERVGRPGLSRQLSRARAPDPRQAAGDGHNSALSSVVSPMSSALCGGRHATTSRSSERALIVLATTASATPFTACSGPSGASCARVPRPEQYAVVNHPGQLRPDARSTDCVTAATSRRSRSGGDRLQLVLATDPRVLSAEMDNFAFNSQHCGTSLPQATARH